MRQGGRFAEGSGISDLDIYRAANLLIRQHGADAELVAAQRVDLMLDRGDLDGRLVWVRIRRGEHKKVWGARSGAGR